jgi:hypothetical protein
MSKGSTPRPRLVSYQEYSRNWDRAFKQDKKNKQTRLVKNNDNTKSI